MQVACRGFAGLETEEQDAFELVRGTEPISQARFELLDSKTIKIPDSELVRVVSGEYHQTKVCSTTKIHVAFQ
jgi:hypothetical protein